MKTRSLVFSLALSLMLLASAFGQSVLNNGTAASPALMNQNAYYGQWAVHSLNAVSSGSNTMTLDNCFVRAGLGNRQFFPFATNVTVTVVDGTNTETALAVTAVSTPVINGISSVNPYTCSFTASFSNAHSAGVSIISADNGVAEAANDNGYAYGVYNGAIVLNGRCTGTANATAGIYGLTGIDPTINTIACNSTAVTVAAVPGTVINRPGLLKSLSVTATAAGTNSSSGAVTLNKNGSATTITCTIGTGTSCSDTTHTVSVAAGDIISITFTDQTSDTLAGLNATALVY